MSESQEVSSARLQWVDRAASCSTTITSSPDHDEFKSRIKRLIEKVLRMPRSQTLQTQWFISNSIDFILPLLAFENPFEY
jgi:hypothetical protein